MYLIQVFDGDEVTEHERCSTIHASSLYRKLEAKGKQVQLLRAATNFMVSRSHFKVVINSWEPKIVRSSTPLAPVSATG